MEKILSTDNPEAMDLVSGMLASGEKQVRIVEVLNNEGYKSATGRKIDKTALNYFLSKARKARAPKRAKPESAVIRMMDTFKQDVQEIVETPLRPELKLKFIQGLLAAQP